MNRKQFLQVLSVISATPLIASSEFTNISPHVNWENPIVSPIPTAEEYKDWKRHLASNMLSPKRCGGKDYPA